MIGTWFEKNEHSFIMFKEFRYPENTDKNLSVHYFSPDRTKITLMVYMSSKTIKFKQQMEFESLKIIQDFKKVYMRRFLFCLVYMFINEISHS